LLETVSDFLSWFVHEIMIEALGDIEVEANGAQLSANTPMPKTISDG